jgi:hypothetical protein
VLNIIQGQGERIIMSFLLTAILVPPIRLDADLPPAPQAQDTAQFEPCGEMALVTPHEREA